MNYIVGVDIGGTNIKAGLVKKDTGEIVKSYSIKTESEKGSAVTFDRINDLINQMLDEASVAKSDVEGVGVGIPGPVLNQEIVAFFANFPWDKNLNIKKELEDRTGLKVIADNDVNVITMGEAWQGAAKGYKNVLGLALGTGVGGGIIIDGHLIGGTHGAGGEIGHMIIEKNGKLCGCGHKGCLETYCSATGVIRETVSRLFVNKNNLVWEKCGQDIRNVEAKHVFDAAKEGDAFAIDIVKYVVNYLALGIGNMLNAVNPEVVVIGGGVSLAGDILFDALREELNEVALGLTIHGLSDDDHTLVIVPAKLGNDAGVIGAAALIGLN